MKQVKQRQQETQEMSANMSHRMREGLLIFLAAIAAYLFIAFVTYHSSDPGWSSSGSGGFVANAGGKVGAWIADVFLYLFGYIAYLFPLMFCLTAWFVLYDRIYDIEFKLRNFCLRFAGFVITLIAGCSLANLLLANWHSALPLTAGGILGSVVETSFVDLLNNIGSALILTMFFLIGVILCIGVSWLHLLGVVGKVLLQFCGLIKKGYTRWRELVKERRAAELLQKQQRINNRMREVAQRPIKAPVFQEVREKSKSKQPVKNKVAKPDKVQKDKVTGTLPSLDLLDKPQSSKDCGYSLSQLEDLSRLIEQRLLEFDIEAIVVDMFPGPVITRFELELAPGLKVSRVTSLVKDLARSLSMVSVRVVEVIPGKSVIGLEVPNKARQFVYLREIFESKQYVEATSSLSLALGKNIAGDPVIVDLMKMPHMLVCGTTGSGKSVGLNAMIFSILYKATPEQVRFIMVDPKMLELSVYDGIPHLLTPVVTNMKEAANAFRWCVAEMERRFQLMAALRVRNIAGYNTKINHANNDGNPIPNPLIPEEAQMTEPEMLQPLPYIVLIVDELSDMMMLVGKKVEELIARLAQKARAAGIHMILATQRPSVDVITGLIKSNIPTRIAFQVSSKIDSRTILDQQGAEQLLGHGDMLYLPAGAGLPERVHGAYVSDSELQRVIADWKQRGEPEYVDEVLQEMVETSDVTNGNGEGNAEQDPLYDQAVRIVTETRRASISYIQRRLKIGYNRSANMLDAMEQAGVVSKMENSGAREVLAPPPPEED